MHHQVVRSGRGLIQMEKQGLIEQVSRSSLPGLRTLLDAIDFTDQKMEGQFRHSGEAAANHGFEVGSLIFGIGCSAEEAAAAVMHDLDEDTPVTLEEIEERFGQRVAFLVGSVSKEPSFSQTVWPVSKFRYYAKLLERSESDVLVILLKLADRLHNMRTLQFLQRRRQELNAWETIHLLLPLAEEISQRANGSFSPVQPWLRELEELARQYYPDQPDHFPDFQNHGDMRTIIRIGSHSVGAPSPLSFDL